jgi:hypothetical protein
MDYFLDNWGSFVGVLGVIISTGGLVIAFIAMVRAGKAREAAAAAEEATRDTQRSISTTLANGRPTARHCSGTKVEGTPPRGKLGSQSRTLSTPPGNVIRYKWQTSPAKTGTTHDIARGYTTNKIN